MGFKRAIASSVAGSIAVVAVLVGCSDDPSVLSDGHGGDQRHQLDDDDPESDSGVVTHEGGAESGHPPSDAGAGKDAHADAPVDAAHADAAPQVTAFTGAAPFVATTGPSARRDTHAFAGNTPTTNPAKQPCLGCHSAGGAATPFAFAGTVFKDVAGTIPAVGVEIRVRAPDGGALSAYTDQDGNFYQAASVGFPANVGVRSATNARLMMAPPPDGGCNASQCHDGNAHPWVYLP
jgi:hypothetical protein